ncbi:hypothetical protein D9M68_888240 [compost metagenome]
MAQQQAGQAIALGAVEQGHGTVLAEVPEQPGIVVFGDIVVLPDPAVAQHADQAVAMIELQQVRRGVAVGPCMGAVLGVVEVELGIEAEIGRRPFILQVELGQFGIRIGLGDLVVRFRCVGSRRIRGAIFRFLLI